MPLPLGHTAIGLAVHETTHPDMTRGSRVELFAFITVLANLPDIDILFGLLIAGNGSAFHRGPTHSLLFALIAGYLAAKAGSLRRRIPQLGFGLCTLLIFSHVLADMFLTSAPVSIFWPFEVHWTLGQSGWFDVINLVMFQSLQDFIIAAVVVCYIFTLRKLRSNTLPVPAKFSFDRKKGKNNY